MIVIYTYMFVQRKPSTCATLYKYPQTLIYHCIHEMRVVIERLGGGGYSALTTVS